MTRASPASQVSSDISTRWNAGYLDAETPGSSTVEQGQARQGLPLGSTNETQTQVYRTSAKRSRRPPPEPDPG